MDNDSFIRGLVNFFIAADLAVMWASMAFVGLTVVGGVVLLVLRRWRWGAACLALAAAPYVMHGLAVERRDARVDRRAAELQALPRTPLTPDHPRVLEAQVMRSVAARILPMGRFDVVHSYEDPIRPERLPERRTAYRWMDTAECAALAADFRSGLAAGERSLGTTDRALEACVTEDRTEEAGPRPDAVLFLRDRDTTFAPRGGTIWAGGLMEVRLRQGGRDVLVDLWETPHVPRPRTPALGQRQLGPTSETPEFRSWLEFLVTTVEAAHT